ncbi:MAG: hypothetical protein SFZ23_10795 [Planctomycetota bacterium]|nr:hypothetical protein [Planctomycetota bacterium]
MVKFLRKNGKFFLVGFGILLMISFLAPQQCGQPSPADITVATLGGKKVTAEDMENTARRFSAVQDALTVVPVLSQIRDETQWYLLVQEAKNAGLVGGDADGAEWLSQLAVLSAQQAERFLISQFERGFNQELFQQYQEMFGDSQKREATLARAEQEFQQLRATLTSGERAVISPIEFDRGLAEARGVQRLLEAYLGAATLSDRRFVKEARRLSDAVVLDYVLIPATVKQNAIAEPTPEQVQAHYEKYREAEPGSGELGFGYRQPPVVKVEYVVLDPAALSGTVTLDPVEVNARWRSNRTRYPGEFWNEREKVEKDMRDDRVRALMSDAERAARGAVLESTRLLTERRPYFELPPASEWDAKRPKAEMIAQRVVDELKKTQKVSIALPEVVRRDDTWLSEQDLSALPGIGASSLALGGRSVPFSQLAMQVRELAGDNTLGLQVGLPYIAGVTSDAEGKRYLFTIIAARKAQAPDSLSEVSQRVVADVKQQLAFEALLSERDQIEQLAENEGLEAVGKRYAVTPPAGPDGSQPEPRPLPVRREVQATRDQIRGGEAVLNRPEFLGAIQAAAQGVDPLAPPLDPAALGDSVRNRVIALPIPGGLGVAALRVVATRPLTIEEARQTHDQGFIQILGTELREASKEGSVLEPFTLASLTARLNYVPRRQGREEATPSGAAPAATPADAPAANPATPASGTP